MTVTTPKLALPKPQGSDNARDYLKGAIAGGGLWTALQTLDNAILSTGAITLDNATLNNPTITGWTNANHSHASAAQAGSTLGPGATLSSPAFAGVVSTGAQFAGNLGVGVAPAAWDATGKALQLGNTGAVYDVGGFTQLLNNLYEAAGSKALAAGHSSKVILNGGNLVYQTSAAAAGAAGAAVTLASRFQVARTGALTTIPDATALGAANALEVTGYLSVQRPASTQDTRLAALGAGGALDVYGTGLVPFSDNAMTTGTSGRRWSAVYAVAGTINTSAADLKADITPLDPATALAAVLATDPVTFTYTTPPATAEQYELPDDPEQAERVLHQRLVNAPLMEAARHQAGFVLHDETGGYQTDPLFETGLGQSNAANTAGILLGAIHALETRLAALEGA